MSESEDSNEVDESVSLPKHRCYSLFHPNVDTDRVKALKEAVRNKKLERDENILKKTEFDRTTEDESSSKKIIREDSELSGLQGKISETYQKETED